MKKTFLIALLIPVLHNQVMAQPLATQVKSDFMKNGVTAVDGITIDKETHLDHSRWKASFTLTIPVKPDEVEGQTGVTLLKHMNAWYECSGKVCRMTESSLTNSEYKGADIPSPDQMDLVYLVKKQLMSEPSFIVSTMDRKTSFDSVKVPEPKINWINPERLVFEARIFYTEKANPLEVAAIESPVNVTLKRTGLKSEFSFSSADQQNERNKELSRKKINIGPTKYKEEPPVTSTIPPVAGAWKKGDKVLVEENGKWYPSTVVFTKDKQWFIHYDGFDSRFDEWAAQPRIKNK